MINPAYVLESLIPRDLIKYELTKYNVSGRQERINECKKNYYERVIYNSDIFLYDIKDEYEKHEMDDYIEFDQENIYEIMLNFQKKMIEYEKQNLNIDKAIVLSMQTLKNIHNGCHWWNYEWDVQYEIMILGGIERIDLRYELDNIAIQHDPHNMMNQIMIHG